MVPVRPAASRRRPSGSRIASSVRSARTSSTRSRTSRRATNRSARSESMSAHCASSTTMTKGAFCSSSARASRIRAPTPTGSSPGSDRSRPARSRAALTPATRMSWSTTPYATNASHCSPVARSTVRSDSSSRKRSSTAVLPIPGDPSRRMTRGRPDRTVPSSARSAVSSTCRPTKEWAFVGDHRAHLRAAADLVGHARHSPIVDPSRSAPRLRPAVTRPPTSRGIGVITRGAQVGTQLPRS